MLLLALTLTFGSLTTEDSPRVTSQLKLVEASDTDLKLVSNSLVTPPDRGGAGWTAASIIGLVPVGLLQGVLTGLAISGSAFGSNYEAERKSRAPLTVGLGLVSAIGAGIGGYYLGEAARNGSVAAKIGIVLIDILGTGALLTTVGVVALMNSGFGYIPT